jgi:hypothetical protein
VLSSDMRTRSEHGRGVREEGRGGVDVDEGRDVEEVNGGTPGGDHATFEFRRS